MTREERQRLIDQYAKGPDEVTQSLAGFPATQLTAHPIPGKWSAAEIIHHLSDSETVSGIRLRRLVAETNPVIWGYDQEQYARALRYNERDIAPALENFRAVRAATTPLIRAMTDAEWLRPGWHTESGLYTGETWLAIYAVHAHNHAAQIRRLGEALTVKR
ncbi:MAG TPA: DinB family protein [Dongiaceae bacterium]|nr:DinB family protein [Dongiaceae bacterium]